MCPLGGPGGTDGTGAAPKSLATLIVARLWLVLFSLICISLMSNPILTIIININMNIKLKTKMNIKNNYFTKYFK